MAPIHDRAFRGGTLLADVGPRHRPRSHHGLAPDQEALLQLQSTAGKPNLDAIAIGLARDLRAKGEVLSFVDTSRAPEDVELASGTIKANGVEITNDGNNILFLNGVKARFTNTKTGDSTP